MIKINSTVKQHSRHHMHAVLTSYAYAVSHTHRNGSGTPEFYSQKSPTHHTIGRWDNIYLYIYMFLL